ncbi:MAG TPA: translation elongation factor Ts [Gemmatimonadaceae bacterium]|nr:translation elongation factor Ts [Gemmatimonadaceae bacterium]
MTTRITGITAKDVAELRARTGAGMMDCKKALEESGGDLEKAVDYLRKRGIAKADKRAGREVKEGQITSYIHHNGKVGVLVEVNCETDFVARTDEFKQLARSIAEHVAAGVPAVALAVGKEQVPADRVAREREIFTEQARASGKPDNIVAKMVEGRVEKYYQEVALLEQPWVRDDKKTIGDLVKEASAKTGENISVRRFVRFQMGEE